MTTTLGIVAILLNVGFLVTLFMMKRIAIPIFIDNIVAMIVGQFVYFRGGMPDIGAATAGQNANPEMIAKIMKFAMVAGFIIGYLICAVVLAYLIRLNKQKRLT